ncbi:MAG: hypothetical protein AAF492_06435 [Verrucomicrobiota bacterium]
MTEWTVVDEAAKISTEAGINALDSLLLRYLPALKTWLVYVKKQPGHLAEEYIQSFVARKVLEGDLLSRADRNKGRFRTYLLTSFDRFIQNELRRDRTRKRLPEGGFVHMDEAQDAATDESQPSQVFDVAWAQGIMNRAMEEVREDCKKRGREHFWRVFESRVVNPILHNDEVPSYTELMQQTGFSSPMQASNALVTVKRMFARSIRRVIGEYANGPRRVDEELHELRQILRDVL